MKKTKEKLIAIPTNIITGFLGVGKTSTILHLLKSKPSDERWAVLVNEFGEIGVDGSLFKGQHSEEQQVYIREVPGGCMCCAAGLPMQIALNQLLTRARPHRLLIEPTGLGHPIEVMEVLTADYYREVLAIEKIVTLVDARKLDETRYTEHQTFNQQIAIADIIVGNKQDLYQTGHKTKLEDYVKAEVNAKASPEVKIVFAEQGKISLDLLQGATGLSVHAHHHQENTTDNNLNDEPMPESGYLKAVNQGEGFHSIGWRFEPTKVFDHNTLFAFLNGIVAERMKAVFITENGIYGYNLTSDALTEIELDDCMESRIEIIASELSEQWEEQLLACIKEAG
jgi:G3E family GTPase